MQAELSGLIDAALEIAEKREQTLERLEAALRQGDTPEVYKFAKELCGLKDEALPTARESVH
jgi:hypothetical protein